LISAGLTGVGRFGKLFIKHFSEFFDFHTYDLRPDKPAENDFPVLGKCNYLFIAVTISKLEDSFKAISKYVNADTAIVDLCSVKEYPIDLMMKYFPKNEIIGLHPLFGPESAARSVAGHQMVMVKTKKSLNRYCELKTIFEKKKLEVVEMSAEEHDKLMAWTLCLTQFIGRGLKDLQLPENKTGTKGYFALLDIVKRAEADREQLFIDMNLYNKFSSEMRQRVLSSLTILNEQLEKINLKP
jgi:prephenate dehydrogenase